MANAAELALILSLVDEVSKTAKSIKGELKDVGKESQGLKDVVQGLGKVGFGVLAGGVGLAAGAITGLGAALIDATGAAAKEQQSIARLSAAVQAAGQSWQDVAGDIDAYLAAELRRTGLDDGEGRDSLARLVTVTKSASEAMKLNALAQDLAASKGIELRTATEAVIKGYMGAGGVFKQFGIDIREGSDVTPLEQLRQAVSGAAEAMGNTAAGNAQKLDIILGNVKETIGARLLPLVGQLGTILVNVLTSPVIQQGIDMIANGVGALGDKLGLAVTLLTQGDVQGALTSLFGPEIAAQILSVANAVGSFVGQVVTFVTEHSESFKGALIAIGAVLAAATILSGIMAVAGAIAALANPITLIILAAGLLGAAWASNWGGIQDKTRAVIDWIMPYIQAGLAAIRGWWAAHGEQVIATITTLWETAKNAFSAALKWIQDLISTAIEAIQGFWVAHGETIISLFETTWNSIESIFNAAFTILKSLVTAVIAVFKGDWKTFGESLETIVSTIWETIKTLFSNAVKNLTTLAGDIVRSVTGKFTEIDWAGVGRNVIEGIAGGIMNAASGLAQRAAGAAREALDAAKRALGISSPSRLAAAMIGRPFVAGIAAGIAQAMPRLQSAVQLQMGTLARGGQQAAQASYVRNFYLTANYGRMESEMSLRDTVRALSMAG